MNTYDVGDTAPLRLTVAPSGDDTVATVEVFPPAGGSFALAAKPNDDRSEWRTALVLTDPGLWLTKWTVTGTGEGTESHEVAVRPGPGASSGRAYATTADLARWSHDAPAAAARVLLVRATARVDELLLTAVYEVDGSGMPLHVTGRDGCAPAACVYRCPVVALRDAACAQAQWFDEAGDDTGSGGAEAWSSVRIGNVQLGGSGGDSDGGSSARRYAPEAVRVLRAAGLLGHGPAVLW